MSLLRLTAGDWRATVAPEQGGAILSLDWQGRHVFRPTPEGATDMLEMACFPLVPYANRIADARFGFEGRDVRLTALDRFAPHALHGDGWLNTWAIDTVLDHRVETSLEWPGEVDLGGAGWPWPWRARQTVRLSEDGLEIVLSVTNTGDAVMPAGLGLHPYFHKSPDSRLSLSATGVWLTDAREIPVRIATPDAVVDWSGGRALAEAPFVDHAYAGWDGEAVIEGGGQRVFMRGGAGAEWAQVYAPVGADFFCVEPVTHRPDVLNAPLGERGGLARLLPGESLSLVMTVTGEDL